MCRTKIVTQKIIWQGLLMIFLVVGLCVPSVFAIDVELTLEQAKQIIASARGPIEKTSSNEEMFTIIKAADKKTRIAMIQKPSPVGVVWFYEQKRIGLNILAEKKGGGLRSRNEKCECRSRKLRKF